MTDSMDRRQFITTASITTAAAAAMGSSLSSASARQDAPGAGPAKAAGSNAGRIYKSLKSGMVGIKGSWMDRFKALKGMGYDGIDFDAGLFGVNAKEILEARDQTGLHVHGVVDPTHWGVRLSSPNEKVRANAVADLEKSIRIAYSLGGSTVLLVPGAVHKEDESMDDLYKRSQIEIRKALPLASRLGVSILIENVWNGFLLEDREKFRQYIDDLNSPWVGSYFDIGNIRRYGLPEEWIRTLRHRIAKLDIKGWSKAKGFNAEIGDDDINWPEVRKALKEIEFTGWATAEVGGGDEKRLAKIAERMNMVLDI